MQRTANQSRSGTNLRFVALPRLLVYLDPSDERLRATYTRKDTGEVRDSWWAESGAEQIPRGHPGVDGEHVEIRHLVGAPQNRYVDVARRVVDVALKAEGVYLRFGITRAHASVDA